MTQTEPDQKSLPCLLAAQTQVVFNDNAAKLMLILLAGFPGVLPAEWVAPVTGGLAMLLILPFIGFSPVAGWLADRFSKRAIVQGSLAAQTGIMAALAAAFALGSFAGAVVCFFLLAVQSTVLSPAKRGILKELVGSARLSSAVGWMEMLTIAAILAGSLGGGLLFDLFTGMSAGDPWQGGFWTTAVLLAASFGAWAVFQAVRPTPAQSDEPYRHDIWWRHFRQVAELWRSRPLFRAGLGGAYFFTLGGVLYLTLVEVARGVHGGEAGTGSLTAFMLGMLGTGTIAGCLSAGRLSRGHVELGWVPVGCVGLVFSLAALALLPPQSPGFFIALVALGFSGGVYLVPLYAYLQENAGDHRRGRILAAVNVIDGIGGLAAAGAYVFMANTLGLTPSGQLAGMLLATIGVSLYIIRLLPENFVRAAVRLLALPIYRIRVRGAESLPAGGAVVIANHVSYLDAVILQLASPRRIHFMGLADLARRGRWFPRIFRWFRVIPVSAGNAKGALNAAAETVKAGGLVCIFPEGQITRTGAMNELKKGFSVLARRSRAPVVPVYLDGLWGSIFSFRGGRFFRKLPSRFPYPVTVRFGEPIPYDEATPERARRALGDLGEKAFSERPELRRHLGRECVRSLARHPRRTAVVDTTSDRKALRAGKLLAVSAALSRRIRKTVPERRVGIVLPPGIGGTIANLAVVLAGKIPVNLNFTAGRAAAEASLARGGIETVITAPAMKTKVGDFPWPERTLDLAAEIRGCGRAAVLVWLVAAATLPSAFFSRLLGLPRRGDREEAGLLFTSGSSGAPKGVALTHRNLLGNILQMDETGIIAPNDTVLASLPLFHSFGFTVTLWYALINRIQVVTTPSPLDARKIARAIEAEKATLYVGTPTFLRGLLKTAAPDQLRSLRLVVSGAEKLPEDLADAFHRRFVVSVHQGYGLTETSPVVAVNLPDPATPEFSSSPQRGHLAASAGRLLPGITARIVDPGTGRELPLDREGILQLKGPNVFSGYLDAPEETRGCFDGDWFVSGDLARFDADGFLHIAGRLSRFSKIAGEMVPHGKVEETIVREVDLGGAAEPAVFVGAIPDPEKGEALVVLTTVDLDPARLRTQLTGAGLPRLWIPRKVVRVSRIPVLGSGKLDLKACRKMIEDGTAPRAEKPGAVIAASGV